MVIRAQKGDRPCPGGRAWLSEIGPAGEARRARTARKVVAVRSRWARPGPSLRPVLARGCKKETGRPSRPCPKRVSSVPPAGGLVSEISASQRGLLMRTRWAVA
jgi:hypothetical protein